MISSDTVNNKINNTFDHLANGHVVGVFLMRRTTKNSLTYELFFTEMFKPLFPSLP